MVSPGNVIKFVFKHLCPTLIYHPLVYKCSDQLVSASNATHFNTICNITTWGELSSESGDEIFVGQVVLEQDFPGASCLGATCLWGNHPELLGQFCESDLGCDTLDSMMT